MSDKNFPHEGDVIASKKFDCGYYNGDKTSITVDGETKKYPVTHRVPENERLASAAKTGQIPPEKKTVELGAYDESRAEARFVVEEARLQGGSFGHEFHADGWHVRARRLNAAGTYDQGGEVIEFYMSGDFSGIIEPKNVQIVGKMQKRFV